MSANPSVAEHLGQLARLDPDDGAAVGAISERIRRIIEATTLPPGLAQAITDAVAHFGGGTVWAVRSSASAEDLPTASFAGQFDTYLDVVGADAVIRHVRRCWASLFTERAVTYRTGNGIDHQDVDMAVVVQRMVVADAAGVLFTADPVTSDRKVSTVEAIVGPGERLVSGLVTPDAYTVRGDRMIARAVEHRGRPVLTDAQVVHLVRLGRQIEAHLGAPQDIEWCLDDTGFHIVQSRPITTLFPIPDAGDDGHHVYVSVGHQQMMTEAMKPLGLSVWQLTTPAPMHDAGGRLFVDVTPRLASPASRAAVLEMFGRGDPLTKHALEMVLAREDVVPTLSDDPPPSQPFASAPSPIDTDPAIVRNLIERTQAAIDAVQHAIGSKTGTALIDFILDDLNELRTILFDPTSTAAVMAGMQATWWINDHLEEWLGGKNLADVLTRSAPGNVTSEMGLALLDVADAIRPFPTVVALLARVDGDDGFLDQLEALEGGRHARAAIEAYLDRYGMRCVGEIDITRPRWRERPSVLVPAIVSNVKNFQPGEAERRFEHGRRQAEAAEREVLARVKVLPDGDQKATETKAMIDRVRTFTGYREYPKFGMIQRYFIYKQALLDEADRLVNTGALRERDDVFYLTLPELRLAVNAHHVDDELIARRKEEYRSHVALRPPRVITSDGDASVGSYDRSDLPEGTLVGLAVSAGTVEGRARVIFDLTQADLDPGDILVTAFTDPSWTPLFIAVAGLVTEVGGLMTHGAVIAREYGLPAVVGVPGATQRIRDGQRIRINGTVGSVEILSDPTPLDPQATGRTAVG